MSTLTGYIDWTSDFHLSIDKAMSQQQQGPGLVEDDAGKKKKSAKLTMLAWIAVAVMTYDYGTLSAMVGRFNIILTLFT